MEPLNSTKMDLDEINSITKYTLKCKLGVLTRPDGSALFCEGETAVIAGIYGPIEEKMQKIQIDKATVECIYRPVSGLPGLQDRFREHLIRNICATAVASSLYPRTGVVINIQEMQNHGQTISCAINAACMACLDSGIDMKFIFAAVSCFLTKDEEFSFSPPMNESSLKGLFVFVFNNTSGKILATHTEGCFSVEQYQNALSLCRDESENVIRFFKTTLLNVNE
ncbi:exosome complex component RRP46 [Anthonomus grandis grandis]|uniref:exosome complex component RRP46 n=1 Tax=Anthonomus grandis grandis TaxID=2921223 RepID=UPI002165457C|nr:exosome complex component RRP46 [Anthonomus grandis grandis]